MTEQITNPDTHNAMLILGFFMPAGSVLDITADQLIERCTPTQLDRIAGCLWYLQPPSVEQARFAAALVHQLVPLLGLVGANVATLHLVINNRELNDQDIDALVRIMWLMDVRLGHRKLLVKYLWGAVRDAGRTWQGRLALPIPRQWQIDKADCMVRRAMTRYGWLVQKREEAKEYLLTKFA